MEEKISIIGAMISSSFDKILHICEVFLHCNVQIQTFSLGAEKPQDYGQ
jgi:hypothetical protein